MLYYEHFGLERPLFRIISPQSLYLSQANRAVLAQLEWSLCQEPSRFTLVTGESGTGKTTLLQSLLARDHYQIRTAIISNPALPFDALLREILQQFGIGAGTSQVELLAAFNNFLATIEPGGRVAIVVDDAQALSDAALEEIRFLSNSDALEENQLHFMLVGQRELARRMLAPGLLRLNTRIGARASLDRMSRDESIEYLEYCLQAGGGNAHRVFDRRALAHVADHGGGVPRRLNVLCHNAMLLAYSAGRSSVALRDARAAAAEYAQFFISEHSLEAASAGKPRWFGGVRLTRWRMPDLAGPTARPSIDPGRVAGAAPTDL
jgi:type II secretory pathway predicted ATPase ExeA